MCDVEATRDVHVAEVYRVPLSCRTQWIGLASHATALPFSRRDPSLFCFVKACAWLQTAFIYSIVLVWAALHVYLCAGRRHTPLPQGYEVGDCCACAPTPCLHLEVACLIVHVPASACRLLRAFGFHELS
jgi:hypothetical protein